MNDESRLVFYASVQSVHSLFVPFWFLCYTMLWPQWWGQVWFWLLYLVLY